jgi:hypothetical protein
MAEQIKWLNALDAIVDGRLNKGLRLARESQHPDARWMASLFPAEPEVTLRRMREVMREQGDDARALYFVWVLERELAHEPLVRAAEMGYAPAQASLSARASTAPEAFLWAQRAASQGDRRGVYRLGKCFAEGLGCAVDIRRALLLYKSAAEMDLKEAMDDYGALAFGALDWERYLWWGRAIERGRFVPEFSRSVVRLLPSFEKGENGRILHTAAPMIRGMLEKRPGNWGELESLERTMQVHNAMLLRARHAVDCWSMAGRRLRVVKDMRVMIAKMAWAEVWRWGEKEFAEQEQRQEKRNK